MKYIGNKKENGLLYDHKKVRKIYKKLGCPKEYYDPTTCPIEKASWVVEVSARSTGKTTNWLLYGIIMYQVYGTVTHYVRATDNEIAPKNSGTMYNVILQNKYIEIITDGEYNDIIYRSKKWTLAHRTDTGEIDKMAPGPCTYMCSVSSGADLKSSHNEPTGDLIIYDEFLPVVGDHGPVNKYRACDFVEFCDLVKTIFRDRLSGKIIMLANTLDKESQYFHELEIYDRIGEMGQGDRCLHNTDGGTTIYMEIVGAPVSLKSRKHKFNQLFMAFKNSRLSGITGETTWSTTTYPHIPEISARVIFPNIYISHNNKLVRLDIVANDIGTCIYAHWATQCHDDSIILVARDVREPREHHGIGDDCSLGKLIRQIAKNHKFYFAANDTGSFVQNYLNQCLISLPLL